jgi:hypothetical protein
MAKKPTSKDTWIRAEEKNPGSGELRDDDLQEVTGGILVTHPTGPVTTGPIGPTDPTEPTGPTGPVCVSSIT